MKNTYIYIVIIALLMGGILFSGNSKKSSPKTLAAETVIAQTATPTKSLAGISPTDIPAKEPTKTNEKVQIVKATYGPPLGFSPAELTVKAGLPARLEVLANVDGRGCMSTIMIPGLDNRIQTLVKDQTNVFEFTPQTPGEYPITCAMGMPHGAAIIVQ